MLSKKDKNSLYIVAFVIVYAVISWLMLRATASLPALWIGIILLVGEFVVIMPFICSRYYTLKGFNANAGRFVPLWNKLMIFDSKVSVVVGIFYALAVVIIASGFLPIEFLIKIINERNALNYPNNALAYGIISIVVAELACGVGFTKVFFDIQNISHEMTGTKQNKWYFLYCILLYLPAIRILPLITINSRLKVLTVYNNYTEGDATDASKKLVKGEY